MNRCISKVGRWVIFFPDRLGLGGGNDTGNDDAENSEFAHP